MSEETLPLLRVVRGDPTPDQLAALVTVISAMSNAARQTKAKPRSEWSARHRLVRRTHRHGPGAWRASSR